jgi:molybdenum-dependent DNA-binding transcriptional regulator ModE
MANEKSGKQSSERIRYARDPRERQRIFHLPPFDPKKSYTPRQLEDYGTKILLEQRVEERELSPVVRDIIRHLEDVEESSAIEVAGAIGVSYDRARVNLRQMESDGLVEVTGTERVHGGTQILYRLCAEFEDFGPQWLNEYQMAYRKSAEVHCSPDETPIPGGQLFHRHMTRDEVQAKASKRPGSDST